MKKIIKITLFLFFTTTLSYSQLAEKEMYQITYKIDRYDKTKKGEKVKFKSTNRMVQKMFSIMEELKFDLIFNEDKAIFQRRDLIVPDNDKMFYRLASNGVYDGVTYFKDSKQKFVVKEFFGEHFKIDYPYHQYNWKLTNETKIIQGYTCYKATTTWVEKDYLRDIELRFTPEVWFTEDLPFPFAPKGFDGLPGVVLEASSNGQMFFKAIEIKKGKNIKFPKIKNIDKAKKISYIEFSKLVGSKKPKQ